MTEATTDAPGEGGADIQDFVLSRELAEVYLLLDNVSTASSKVVPLTVSDPVFKSEAGRSWIEQVCEIAWPPGPISRSDEARAAAKLLRAKDILNTAAWPATGASIAFTLMVSGEMSERNDELSWWRRWLMRIAGGDTATGANERRDLRGPGSPPSRGSLAATAYPGMQRRAWRYRVAMHALIWFLVLWLLVTCWLSWEVATGSSLLNRVNALTSLSQQEAAAPASTQGQSPNPVGRAAAVQSGVSTGSPTSTPTSPGANTQKASTAALRPVDSAAREAAVSNLRA